MKEETHPEDLLTQNTTLGLDQQNKEQMKTFPLIALIKL